MTKQNDHKFHQSHLNCRLYFNPGMSDELVKELNEILAHLWLKKSTLPELTLVEKKYILLRKIHLHTVFEIISRSFLTSEVFIEIASETVLQKDTLTKFVQSIEWPNFLPQDSEFTLKVDSFKSKLFHEKMIKDICSQILQDKFHFKLSEHDEAKKQVKNFDSSKIYFEIIKNKLTVLIKVNKTPLYFRSYKEVLSKSAPLREDIAHFCLQKLFLSSKIKMLENEKYCVFVPFGGTGTFVFESVQILENISPILVRNKTENISLPFYPEKTVQFFEKKAKDLVSLNNAKNKYIYLDFNKPSFSVFHKNLENFQSAINHSLSVTSIDGDFFSCDFQKILSPDSVIFLPLNPPYGLRMNSKDKTSGLYKKICLKLEEMRKLKLKQLAGFILCPDEESWSVTQKILSHFSLETAHFMQGGLHIRLAIFNSHKSNSD